MNNKKELLFSITKKDFSIEWFSGSGAGGQHRNKSSNCCRIKHLVSGVITTGTEQRSREQNKKMAFKRMISHKDFQAFLKLETARKLRVKNELEKEINNWLDEQMNEKYLKIEYI